MSIFFIADTHFGDDNIRRYENRPFESVAEMDEKLIANWNNTVDINDEVYVLGDFGADGYEKEMLSKLNGVKYLVKGNHDINSNDFYRNAGFKEVYDLPVLYKNFWILSHDAIYVNQNMPYANLFGHVHNNPIIKDYSSQHLCVSAERIKYTPISFELIQKLVKKERGNRYIAEMDFACPQEIFEDYIYDKDDIWAFDYEIVPKVFDTAPHFVQRKEGCYAGTDYLSENGTINIDVSSGHYLSPYLPGAYNVVTSINEKFIGDLVEAFNSFFKIKFSYFLCKINQSNESKTDAYCLYLFETSAQREYYEKLFEEENVIIAYKVV